MKRTYIISKTTKTHTNKTHLLHYASLKNHIKPSHFPFFLCGRLNCSSTSSRHPSKVPSELPAISIEASRGRWEVDGSLLGVFFCLSLRFWVVGCGWVNLLMWSFWVFTSPALKKSGDWFPSYIEFNLTVQAVFISPVEILRWRTSKNIGSFCKVDFLFFGFNLVQHLVFRKTTQLMKPAWTLLVVLLV